MKHILIATAAFAALGLASPILAQTDGPGAFISENAILDTAIPFAIGAREAQQNLRGSFGWSTFQEGLVEGVYFRFDPDGYARFSPSPRLDADVFEVICRPRTYSCMARKDNLSVIPMKDGKIQLKLEDVRPGDGLFLADADSELQLPERILQPLEFQFETLLSAGGNLVVRRSDREIIKTSLSGFGAVVPYLRWIMARQDYTVLPRNWPVPNAQGNADGAITNALGWASPMPQPQAIQQVGPGAQYANTTPRNGLEQVQDDLQELKSLLAERSNQDTRNAVVDPTQTPAQARTTQLESAISELMAEVRLLRDGPANPSIPTQITAASPAPRFWSDPVQTAAPLRQQPIMSTERFGSGQTVDPMKATAIPTEVDHLNYLINQMGLAPKTAMILMQIVGTNTQDSDAATPIERSYHDSLAMTILNELERDLARTPGAVPGTESLPTANGKKSATPTPTKMLPPSHQLSANTIMMDGSLNPSDQPYGVSRVNTKHTFNPRGTATETTDLSRDEYQPLTAYFKSIIDDGP